MIRGQLPDQVSLIHVTVGVPQLSVAVTNVVLGTGTSVTQATVTLAGQVMIGAMLSFTVIVCSQVEVLPQESCAW